MKKSILWMMALMAAFMISCEDNNDDDDMMKNPYPVHNPDNAEMASVDRFSDVAGMLFQRSSNSALPAADAPINFDQAPFITQGLGPAGQMVEYYNFDVQPVNPIPIWVLFYEGETTPVPNQLNIIDAIPGDGGYSDFWRVIKVTVPASYEANSATSRADIQARGFETETLDVIVNCPVVPYGSTASKRMGNAASDLVRGWYKDQVVHYFDFSEKMLSPTSSGQVLLSPIYVTFNVNPDPNDPMSGPPSGFVTESGTEQTHNVIATIPADAAYSPLWMVNVYDNADFTNVMDLSSAQSANVLAMGVANVNCPVVAVN